MVAQNSTSFRLPTNVKPSHYDLTLRPNLDKCTFEGRVQIEYTADTSNPITKVVVNALDLDITKGYVAANETDLSCPMKSATLDKEAETATIEFSSAIPSKGYMTFEFNGILNDLMHGFYATSFKIDGVSVTAATTQFESTHARRCFPCWDEPAIKATFSVTLIYAKGNDKYPNVALSNMPIIEQTGQDVITAKFDKTVIMSTYLLAFIVGPFECISASDGKREHRVFTTPGKKEQGRYALDCSCKALRFYEEYFKVDYPLKKMDLIAIPDFNSGAMENWGLVTYRETCLLVDPGNTSTEVKQWVALVVAHELAHQWFGNLVTMEWWTHLWLNEGFATFMEFLCVANILPEFDIWSQFTSHSYAPAMNLDALHNSHPIEVPVNHPSEIEEIFDDISYAKGSAVIRMLYQYIGDDCFRHGMHDYLTKFAFKNAITEELWESLEKASNKPVTKIMSGWTSQKGFPWLAIKCVNEEGDPVKLSITQSKFTADGISSAEDANSSWLIPIDAITGANPTKTVSLGLIDGKDSIVTVECVKGSWIKLNSGTVGLYRTAYPKEMSSKLWQPISDQTLPPMDRFGILDDSFALCKAGKIKTTELLELLEAYKNETDNSVWCEIDNCFGSLSLLLANTDMQDNLHAFGRKIFANIFDKLKWTPTANENSKDCMTRDRVIRRLVSFGHEAVIQEAKRRYKAHFDKVELLPADLRIAVFRAIASYGNDEEFDSLFKLHQTTESVEEKNKLQRAIGATKDVARLGRVIEFVFSDEVKKQDKAFVLMSMAATHPDATWKLFQDRADHIKELYRVGHLLTRIVQGCTECLIGDDKVQEVSKFFEGNKFSGSERTVKQSIEKIKLRTNWLARDRDAIKAFLSSH